MSPQNIVDTLGADILRLWVASSDYSGELTISNEILKRVVESYRRIRNTLRFLLANLDDFELACHKMPAEKWLEIDRFALELTRNLQEELTGHYERYEFHLAMQKFVKFCSEDLGGFYLDILKDRLYTFDKDSPLRRGSQTVLFETVVALTKLMAPILSFTAEEIWRLLPESFRKEAGTSVHLAMFPEGDPKWIDLELARRWNELLEVRSAVLATLESERREKVIGSSLEAKVVLEANPDRYQTLERYLQDLPAFFIVSDVELRPVAYLPHNPDFTVSVEKASGNKCERCWNYRRAVGSYSDHPTVCDRCIEPVRKVMGEAIR
jgi:isoleucyl-tRNA synthetase